jgi:hypothetical protein
MYINNFLSLQKEVFLSDKEKLSDTYFHDLSDFYIAALVRKKSHILAARNYYSSTRDELDFQYLEDIYGMQNPIDLGFTNIIKPRVDALVGLSLLSEPDFRVSYTDADTIKAVAEEKLQGVLTELQTEMGRVMQQNSNDAANNPDGPKPAESAAPSEGTKDWLKKLTAKYGENYKSSYEVAAQHIINLIQTDSDIDLSNIKKEISKDYFITGEAYTRERYMGEGKDPKKESVRPEYIFTNKPKYDRDLKNTDVVVNHKRVSVHNILKELGDKITKEQAEILFNSYANLSSEVDIMNGPADVMIKSEGSNEMDTKLTTGFSNSVGGLTGDLVDFYHVEWLASTRIPDGKGGSVYREDRYECYRVGSELHMGGRRCDEAPRRRDTPWKTTLSYKALINVAPNGIIDSMVNNMRELQDLYDIMMFFRNNTVANSGVSGSRVNIAAIPKALGKTFMARLTKWVTLRKQGLELVDPTEDGANLFQHYGDFNASIQGDAINAVNAILESLAVQADIVSGVPRQMLGVIEQRDAVENVKVGINQVSVLSLEMFRDIDRCLNSGVQETLDNFKWAYRNKPKQGIYNNGYSMVPFIVSPTKFSLTDYRVTVISSGIENAKLIKIQTLAAEFVKAQAIDPDVLVSIMNKKSVHEVENILKVALAAKKEEMASIQKMQQALDQSQEQISKLEAEIARLENNASMASKERLELDKSMAKADEQLRARELTITEDKNKKEDKISQQEVVLKKQTVELEKEQLLFDTGNTKEIKNNF